MLNITEAKRRKHLLALSHDEPTFPDRQRVAFLLGPRAGRNSKVLASIQGPGETEAVPPLEVEATLHPGEPGKCFPFPPVLPAKCISLKGQGESSFFFSPQKCGLVIVLPAGERLYSRR